MIEVFKTDVKDQIHAAFIIDQIHKPFRYWRANFDLDDCDKILRVTGISNITDAYEIISFVKNFGCHAVILPDDDQLQNDVRQLAENVASR